MHGPGCELKLVHVRNATLSCHVHPPAERSYGWLLPAGAAGQGRGSRSFVHEARASALMHDASYLCPLLLRCAGDAMCGCCRRSALPEHCRLNQASPLLLCCAAARGAVCTLR